MSGASGIRVHMVELSKAARLRLQWFALYEVQGGPIRRVWLSPPDGS